jgi:LysR family hydrogen peroxide-inducible transcriptional activator
VLPTLRQLQYLKLLAQHGSFSRAAEAAHVTQPTLSAGIRELERSLGAAVVDRARSGVILTPVGEEAARRGAAILAQAEDLVQAAQAAARPLGGRVRLGVIPTIAPFLLPRALPLLRERHPELKLFLREDLTARLIAGLKAGELDAALIALPYDTAGLEHALVGDDELAVVAPRGHRLSGGRRVSPEALDQEELILLEDGHCLRDHALGACALAGPRGEGAFAATSLSTLVQMVGSGLGVSLLPAMAAELAQGAPVTLLPLSGTGRQTRDRGGLAGGLQPRRGREAPGRDPARGHGTLAAGRASALGRARRR